MKLVRRISLATSLFTTLLLVLTGLLFFMQWFSTLHRQLELSVRDEALTIARMESIQRNLTTANGSVLIQRKIEELRLATRSQYIYVLNRRGQYYAHTSPAMLGKTERDPFLRDILHSSFPQVSLRHSGSGGFPVIEAAAPVFYQGECTGLVVVGLLSGRIYQETRLNIHSFIFFLIIALFISLYSSVYLARSIKKSMSGLEPDEISRLLGQQAMTLDNLKEGIVTIDQDEQILYFNKAALSLAGLNAADLDQPVSLYSFKEGFRECMAEKTRVQQEVMARSGAPLQCRYEPIIDARSGEILGATALFEDMNTVRIRAEEFTGIKQINEGLRAQNHEFLNKLHTISGLIQLGECDQAIQYITGISHNRKEMTGQLSQRIKDPSVAGLLLGKYNKAQEQKSEFRLNRSCFLPEIKACRDTVLLVLGNLIENSLEEIAGLARGLVAVKVLKTRNELLMEVRDNGRGLPENLAVFQKGVSSKGENRGLGLYLVERRVRLDGGRIDVDSRPGSCRITVRIPVKEKET